MIVSSVVLENFTKKDGLDLWIQFYLPQDDAGAADCDGSTGRVQCAGHDGSATSRASRKPDRTRCMECSQDPPEATGGNLAPTKMKQFSGER